MKKLSPILFALVSAMAAEGLPLPAFNPGTIELPPYSLADGARTGRLYSPAPATQTKTVPILRLEALEERKVLSKMPIVVPRDEMDPKMPIKAPDPSIDFKLLIKTPAVESVK